MLLSSYKAHQAEYLKALQSDTVPRDHNLKRVRFVYYFILLLQRHFPSTSVSIVVYHWTLDEPSIFNKRLQLKSSTVTCYAMQACNLRCQGMLSWLQ